MKKVNHGELDVGEPHPSAEIAARIINSFSLGDLMLWMEAYSSVAIEGNKLGSVCSETIRRILDKEPVSDRYIMGLALSLLEGRKDRDKK